MNKEYILKRVQHLISQGLQVLNTHYYEEMVGDCVNAGLQMGFRTASLSFIRMLYGKQHPYYKDFNANVKDNYYSEVDGGINILKAIKNEIENDWLISFKQLVSAEIFADFLEMSRHLLDLKYKDAAAVMIGSTLEEHLRLLCKINSIETHYIKSGDSIPKKANLLNDELAKAKAYGVLEQKNVTAWLDLRNRAAHGKYDEYTMDNVSLMHQGVLNFIMAHK